jgi:ABC-2 type transport system ATP-binding protein
MADTPAIEIKKLSKCYHGRETYALKDLSLSVRPGEVYGFLGPNGAGKSTAIRTLMNFIQPTSGTAIIMGKDIVTDSVEVKSYVGYLSGDIALYPKVTGQQLLGYLSRLTPATNAHAQVKELARSFQADLGKPLDELSKGNRQKIGLIQAFMHQPAVLILDEPTSGLDPLMQEQFFKLVASAKQRGAAIFLSSHNLAEAQRICDRVGILKDGHLIREQAVGGELGRPVFRVTLRASDGLQQLKKDPALKLLSNDGLEAIVQPVGPIAEALKALSTYDIVDLVSQKLDLEDEFLEFYGEVS